MRQVNFLRHLWFNKPECWSSWIAFPAAQPMTSQTMMEARRAQALAQSGMDRQTEILGNVKIIIANNYAMQSLSLIRSVVLSFGL